MHELTYYSMERIYHEKQSLLHCGLHAVNAIIQDNEEPFTREDFQEISVAINDELASVLDANQSIGGKLSRALGSFVGDWDVSVLIRALEQRGLKADWFDSRGTRDDLVALFESENLVGFLINSKSNSIWAPVLSLFQSGRHWFALRAIRGVWYNLDSNLPSPVPFESFSDLLDFLDKQLHDESTLLHIAVSAHE